MSIRRAAGGLRAWGTEGARRDSRVGRAVDALLTARQAGVDTRYAAALALARWPPIADDVSANAALRDFRNRV